MAIQFGSPLAPNQVTYFLDSVFSTSMSLWRRTLIDNIGASNPIIYDILKSDMYESAPGGTDIAEELMYGLSPMDSYSGFDELPLVPTDGITQAKFSWAQLATPIQYNQLEVIMNEQMIINLVKSRMTQGSLGLTEGFAQHWWWGSAPVGGSLTTPRVSPVNGSLSVNPLFNLVSYNTFQASNTALTIGGLSEYTNSWWRPWNFTSSATTYSTFMRSLTHMYNSAALGTGGPPTHFLMDQNTYENYIHAYWSVYKNPPGDIGGEYPFEGKMFMKAKVIMDDKMPDVYSGLLPNLVGGNGDSTSLTYGTIVALNSKFFKLRYHADRDFEMLKDDSGKAFAKPIAGDYRVGHMAWMGQCTINNRRKQAVMGKIPTNFTS